MFSCSYCVLSPILDLLFVTVCGVVGGCTSVIGSEIKVYLSVTPLTALLSLVTNNISEEILLESNMISCH